MDMPVNTGTMAGSKQSLSGTLVKPISDEISKMLADFFNNRLKAT
jgi:hypothetical protein